ncbi:hypothetical protein QQP08_008948 [Theobroma cacao]|nr:hypothetical protein QQP08_008948 [Theobroma cacao]
MCPPPPGKPYLRYEDGDLLPTRSLNPLQISTMLLPIIREMLNCYVPLRHICQPYPWQKMVLVAGGGDLTCLEKSIPSWNKDVIKDPDGIESLHLKIYWNWVASNNENTGPTHVAAADKVRATFLLGRAHVEKLKHLVTEANSEQLHISTFVVTCAFIWVCLIKSQESSTRNSSDADDNKYYYFQFPFDCRNRLEFPVPETYFGNCLKPGIAEVKKSELIGENGILLAAKAIGNKIKEIENRGFRDVESWVATLMERTRSGRFVSVSGSPKFYVYDINFGWGKAS